MGIMGWVAVGVTTWVVGSVLLALLLGAALRVGHGPGRRAAARRSPAHVQPTRARQRMVRGAA
jgi:hypothetical protein